MVSRSSQLVVVVSMAILASCFAGVFDFNSTNQLLEEVRLDSSKSLEWPQDSAYHGFLSHPGSSLPAPFPGTGWIDRMGLTASKITVPSGETYSSAYAAILYGAPLGNPCRNFNAWVNSFFFGNNFVSPMIQTVGIEWTHYILCYLRNFIGAMLVYYGTGAIFHYFCYVHPMSKEIFKDRVRPSSETIWHQIKLSQRSMFCYVLLPAIDEFLIESGLTRTYYTIEEIGGWPKHIATMIIYFAFVEIGIYWMHRTLHTNKWLYKNVHMCHHQYKKAETLTPWASIAFNPIDGMLQASPYVGALFLVPCHYLTHFGLLFFTAVREMMRHTVRGLMCQANISQSCFLTGIHYRFGPPSFTILWIGM